VFDCYGQELGMVKEKVITLLPKFEVYAHGGYLGCIKKELSLFIPKYDIDYNGWHVEGNIFEWDYSITSPTQGLVATVSKQLFHLTDQYVIDVANPQDALTVLMFVLAIDAEKCSRR